MSNARDKSTQTSAVTSSSCCAGPPTDSPEEDGLSLVQQIMLGIVCIRIVVTRLFINNSKHADEIV